MITGGNAGNGHGNQNGREGQRGFDDEQVRSAVSDAFDGFGDTTARAHRAGWGGLSAPGISSFWGSAGARVNLIDAIRTDRFIGPEFLGDDIEVRNPLEGVDILGVRRILLPNREDD